MQMNSGILPIENSNWSESIGEAILHVGSDKFYASLCHAFLSIPEVDRPMLLYFPRNARPQVLYTFTTEKAEYFQHIESYINGPYILDPFFQASVKGVKAGAYRLNEIAPDNFKKTEYYRQFYGTVNFYDEIAYIQVLPNNAFMHLSLVRSGKKNRFSSQTVRFLKAVSPIINAVILKHWQLTSAEHSSETSSDIHQSLHQVLQLFGSSILTAREQEVLQLVLHGHSNKSAAQKLDISLSTIKLHRKHIYQKLDISSQAELFYLFIESLSCSGFEKNVDPLQTYMGAGNL